MHHVLVFSTSKHSPSDGDALSWLADFADDFAFLHPLGASYWLHQDHVAELLCQGDSNFETNNLKHNDSFQTLRRRATDKQLDVNIVPTERRRKQILIADMDSTIITS